MMLLLLLTCSLLYKCLVSVTAAVCGNGDGVQSAGNQTPEHTLCGCFRRSESVYDLLLVL